MISRSQPVHPALVEEGEVTERYQTAHFQCGAACDEHWYRTIVHALTDFSLSLDVSELICHYARVRTNQFFLCERYQYGVTETEQVEDTITLASKELPDLVTDKKTRNSDQSKTSPPPPPPPAQVLTKTAATSDLSSTARSALPVQVHVPTASATDAMIKRLNFVLDSPPSANSTGTGKTVLDSKYAAPTTTQSEWSMSGRYALLDSYNDIFTTVMPRTPLWESRRSRRSNYDLTIVVRADDQWIAVVDTSVPIKELRSDACMSDPFNELNPRYFGVRDLAVIKVSQCRLCNRASGETRDFDLGRMCSADGHTSSAIYCWFSADGQNTFHFRSAHLKDRAPLTEKQMAEAAHRGIVPTKQVVVETIVTVNLSDWSVTSAEHIPRGMTYLGMWSPECRLAKDLTKQCLSTPNAPIQLVRMAGHSVDARRWLFVTPGPAGSYNPIASEFIFVDLVSRLVVRIDVTDPELAAAAAATRNKPSSSLWEVKSISSNRPRPVDYSITGSYGTTFFYHD